MPEWLHIKLLTGESWSLDLLRERTVSLAIAFILGCVVAGIYRLTQRKANAQAANLVATLVLLTVLIAMVTLVIGDSIARAFSLVGALAIVRFRTVVEDTRDTAFVIFAVGVGMAVGAGFLLTPLVSIPFAALAAFLFRPRIGAAAAGAAEYTLSVRVGVGHKPDALLREAFAKHLEGSRLLATATARQGAAIDVTYGVRLRREDDAMAFVGEVNGLEGVQSVELRRD